MSGETLRALSRAYATGDLDRETYRRDRRALLDAIERGETPALVWHPPEPEAPTVFPDEDDDGDTTQEILPAAMTMSERRGGSVPWLPIGIAAAAIAAFAAVWFVLQAPDAPAPETAQPEPVGPAATFDLFTAFLAANDWSDNTLGGLRMEWGHLDTAEREALLASDSARRLRQAVLDQIAAEAALIELGDAEEALDTQEQLLDLLEQLRLTDARVTRARGAWVAAREKHLDAMTDAALAGIDDEAPADEPAAAPANDPPPGQAATAAPAADAPVAADPEPSAPAPQTSPEEAPREAPSPPETPAAAAPSAATAPTAAASKSVRTNCKPELARKRRPYCIDILDSGVKGPVIVVLPGGEFEMGGTEPSEQPRHRVSIDRPFGLGMFEVSVAELSQFCTSTGVTCPAQPWSDPAYPAVNVTWDFASAFTEWLSTITGAEYRLPSEAEWEYAARAGTRTPYPFGEDIVPTDARYSFTSVLTEPLAANDRSVNRNDFRLYHMLGNVREWVGDAWHETYAGAPTDGSARDGSAQTRVVRGGSYADGAAALRVAARVPRPAKKGDAYTGFRVLRVID